MATKGRERSSSKSSGKLTAAKRKAMPKKDFAAPSTRSKSGGQGGFPINDKKHARLAISGATRSERAGNITKAEEQAIKRRARAKLNEGGKKSSSKKSSSRSSRKK